MKFWERSIAAVVSGERPLSQPCGLPAPPEGNVVNLRVSGAGDEGITPTPGRGMTRRGAVAPADTNRRAGRMPIATRERAPRRPPFVVRPPRTPYMASLRRQRVPRRGDAHIARPQIVKIFRYYYRNVESYYEKMYNSRVSRNYSACRRGDAYEKMDCAGGCRGAGRLRAVS